MESGSPNGVTTMMIAVRVAKLGEDFDFNVEALPATSIQYLLTYGATQSVNDAAASIIRKNFESDETFVAAVREKINTRRDQILSGNVPGSKGVANPAMAKARALVARMAEDPALAAKVEELLAA
jgi:hypothetical protein